MNATRPAVPSDDMALDLSRLMQAIGGALRWLLPLVLIVAGGFFLALQLVPSKYKGEAKVLIESTDGKFPGATRGVEEERALLDAEGISSQVQLLMSADLARRVAKRLDLSSVPEFKAAIAGSALNDLLSLIGLSSDTARSSVEEKVLKHYYENLQIYRLEGSRVIAVEYSAQDPELAAAVANTILDEYIALQASAKRETTEVAATAMEPQIQQLQREVQAARKAVADYRSRADLLVGKDNLTLNQQQLADISSKYSAAQAKKAEAQAKADQLRGLLKSGGSLDTASDVLNSQLIQRLREQEVAIQSKIAELSITLLPNHPQLKALNSQLAGYKKQIRSEVRKVLAGLENDAKVSDQQAAALEKRLKELKTAAASSNADQVKLSELEREANAKASQLDTLMSSFREADMRLRAQALPADARIISRASIPVEPYAPKVLAITIISALVTFVLGCAYVILREFLSGNVLYPVEEEGNARLRPTQVQMPGANWNGRYETGGSPAYSMTGSFSGFDAPPAARAEPQPDVVERELPLRRSRQGRNSGPAQARSRTDYDRDIAPDWVADTGYDEDWDAEPAGMPEAAAPIEGRTVVLSVDQAEASQALALDLARKASEAGDAVLFLEVFPEADDPRAAPGFSDLVAGVSAFSKVIYRDSVSGVHIIEAGRLPIDDQAARSARFGKALEAVFRTYDTVVVNLGTIDGTLASARLLGYADRILVTSAGGDYGQELNSAANLLAHNTGAPVEVVKPANGKPSGKKSRRGAGRAA
ncbi:GumC family protein [Roseibium aggregatum]|uniref:Succinoglycan transporter n=1 Tax=Roseibium aggregatum TaxID=187304 RepID=A0A926S4F9_9HYPH|nr:GumC family protein [Roseibium aggregatum]MBD1545050.1 succinoglycan transporter [Roseibium aggregatum]